MTTLQYVHTLVLPCAYTLLPEKMNSPAATAFLIAIGLQESEFQYRRQLGNGAARGFWQFEKGGGVYGVLNHRAVDEAIAAVLETLRYPPHYEACYEAIEHHDVLAACFARCLLWTDPQALPGRGEAPAAWDIYLRTWRPGKPHEQTWFANYRAGWDLVRGELT